MKKCKVGILFGGNSDEYEISLKSCSSVLEAWNHDKYEAILIGINRQGDWYLTQATRQQIRENTWESLQNQQLSLLLASSSFQLKTQDGQAVLVDIFFPILHGKKGEDGTLQGMFELFNIPFVGCNMSSSFLCMDKIVSHQLAKQAGIAVSAFCTLSKQERLQDKLSEIHQLCLPCFVKPAWGGSSIGITKVYAWSQLEKAIHLAFAHDDRVIIEEMVVGQEIGCSLLETKDGVTIGAIDRICLASDFFDYQEKYVDTHAKVECPANFSIELQEKIKKTAFRLWELLQCRGLARIDCFLSDEGEILFNEINSLPGLTATSRYPRMMKLAKIEYASLIEQLLDQAWTNQ